MLKILRKTAGGIVGFIIIGFLIVAFGLWGFADTFTGMGQSELAQVGNTEINRDEFNARLGQEITILSRQLGEPITLQQARVLGVDKQIIASMTGNAALVNLTDDIGLAYGDAAIAQTIIEDANFHGPSGTFDAPTFRDVLRRNGLTENMFVTDQRLFHTRRQFLNASLEHAQMPRKLVERLFTHFLERRIARYAILTLDEIDEVGEPTQAELENFYNATQLRFSEPERRTAQILIVTPERFSETITIDAADLRAEYEASIGEFVEPEQRAVDQLVLADDSLADKIRTMIVQGKSFAEIAATAGQTLENTNLGTIGRDDFISADLAQRAFAMEKGAVSDIIEGPLGFVVLRVRDIKPEIRKTLAQVSDILRDRLAYQQAIEDMIAFSETVEDDRAAGVSLQEIAQRFDLDIFEIDGIDRDGRMANGKFVPLAVRYNNLPEIIFEALPEDNLPMEEMGDGALIWIELKSVDISHVRPLIEVEKEAVAQWKANEQSKLLQAMAAHLVTTGNQQGFAAITKLLNRDPLTSEPMTRQVNNETFSEEAVHKLFSLKKDEFTFAPIGFGTELIVLQAKDIIRPEIKDGEARDLIFGGELRKYRTDLTVQFVDGLKQHYGTHINQAALEQALNALRY